MILIVTYDLHQPGRNYAKIAAVLKTASAAQVVHPQGSVWLLDTMRSCAEWRDLLKNAADPNDEFFVTRLRHDWAAFRMDKAAVDWIKSSSRRW